MFGHSCISLLYLSQTLWHSHHAFWFLVSLHWYPPASLTTLWQYHFQRRHYSSLMQYLGPELRLYSPGLQIRVCTRKLFFLFLTQNTLLWVLKTGMRTVRHSQSRKPVCWILNGAKQIFRSLIKSLN